MPKNNIPEKYRNPPTVVVKTSAKSVRGKLEAIIGQHLVCNWPDDGNVAYLTKDAVRCILNEFDVTEKRR